MQNENLRMFLYDTIGKIPLMGGDRENGPVMPLNAPRRRALADKLHDELTQPQPGFIVSAELTLEQIGDDKAWEEHSVGFAWDSQEQRYGEYRAFIAGRASQRERELPPL